MTREQATGLIKKWSEWSKEHEGYDLVPTYHATRNMYHEMAIVVLWNNCIVAVYTDGDYFDQTRNHAKKSGVSINE